MLKYIQALDTRTFLTLFDPVHRPDLTRLSLILSFTADGWLYFSLLPVLVVCYPHDFRHYFLLAVVAFLLERALYLILKNGIRRRRPPHILSNVRSVITASDRFSLPSGHTSAAFLFVTFLCVGVSPLFMPLYLWAAGVGASRVVLGVHFPTDILLGALLGSSVALAVLP
jgi:undecaprenyl-diphosphatase